MVQNSFKRFLLPTIFSEIHRKREYKDTILSLDFFEVNHQKSSDGSYAKDSAKLMRVNFTTLSYVWTLPLHIAVKTEGG